jgi:UDP:flavonoid glycosyltransferase YjiC (YdhE family)
MTAQEQSHETKQGHDKDRHEPRFLVSTALKVKSLPADRLLAIHRSSTFDFWRGDITLVAEPAEFSGVKLPLNHFFIGPLVPQNEFQMPDEIKTIPKDKPLIYFAMGSSGTPEIVAKIVEGFADKPYRVIAPVTFQLALVPSVRIPPNVIVTDWVPALPVNQMADLTVIHGGIGTVLTAAMAGKPVVGVGMQMEQVANLACLERLGFAIRVPKSKDPSRKILAAIDKLLHDERAKTRAADFANVIAKWDGPNRAAEILLEHYGASDRLTCRTRRPPTTRVRDAQPDFKAQREMTCPRVTTSTSRPASSDQATLADTKAAQYLPHFAKIQIGNQNARNA